MSTGSSLSSLSVLEECDQSVMHSYLDSKNFSSFVDTRNSNLSTLILNQISRLPLLYQMACFRYTDREAGFLWSINVCHEQSKYPSGGSLAFIRFLKCFSDIVKENQLLPDSTNKRYPLGPLLRVIRRFEDRLTSALMDMGICTESEGRAFSTSLNPFKLLELMRILTSQTIPPVVKDVLQNMLTLDERLLDEAISDFTDLVADAKL